jgi:hypothetical protein
MTPYRNALFLIFAPPTVVVGWMVIVTLIYGEGVTL